MLNNVMLIGNLGADPECRTTADGTSVANFRMATSGRWRDRSGALQERTEWHTVTCWRNLADVCGKYLKKGSRVYIDGSLHYTKWTDAEGITRYGCEINAHLMRFLDPPSERPGTPEEITDHATR